MGASPAEVASDGNPPGFRGNPWVLLAQPPGLVSAAQGDAEVEVSPRILARVRRELEVQA